MHRFALIGFALLTLALTVFAAVRAAPYLRPGRAPVTAPDREQRIRVIENTQVPTYDTESLKENADTTRDLVRQAAHQALLALPTPQRPNPRDAGLIADAYADFYVRDRLSTLEEAIASYAPRGLEVPSLLVQDHPTRSQNFWALSTAWARHAPFAADAVRARQLYANGRDVVGRQGSGAAQQARTLASGGFLNLDPHQYTAYEITTQALVPNLDGKSEFPVDVCVILVNDRPGGGWDVVLTTWDNLPEGRAFTLPCP